MRICDAKDCAAEGKQKLGAYILCEKHWVMVAYDAEPLMLKPGTDERAEAAR